MKVLIFILSPLEISSSVECPSVFDNIGGKCILVDPFAKGNWDEAEYFYSQVQGSRLAVLEDVDLYQAVVAFINDNGEYILCKRLNPFFL